MPAPLLILIGGVFIFNQIGGAVMQAFPPLRTAHRKESYSLWPNEIPTMIDAVAMRHWGQLTESAYLELGKENGFNNEYAEKFYNISGHLLSIADYITLWRRDKITEEELDNRLLNLRLDAVTIENAKKVTEYFPNPQDLIHFAVREVYNPEIVSRFGMMQDLPQKFITEAAKGGVQKEQAENYWAAHWVLPSINQGFEMLHRGVIDNNTLNLLLKALDVMPFWRDALTKISYNPLTRVDVRRMYRLDVLDEQGVYDAYLNIGYSPEDAQKMLEFTVRYENAENVGISRSNVMSSYQKGLISNEQLKVYLQGFGYTDNVVSYWLSVADFEKDNNELDTLVNELTAQYNQGIITLEVLQNTLNGANLPAVYVENVVSKVSLKLSAKRKTPSQNDLIDWLHKGIIDSLTYSMHMKQLGFTDELIINYLTEYELDGKYKLRRFLSTTDYKKWLASGIMNKEIFRTTLEAMQVSDEDIDRFIMEVDDASTDTNQ